MMIAQQLYEGIELPGEDSVGLITYMRTDSTRVGDQAITDVRGYIDDRYGAACVPEKPRYFRKKADAQDAHEAIRPTGMQYDPETVRPHLTGDQYSLYRLIWNRFVASQMAAATFDDTTIEVEAGEYLLRAKGSVPTFGGWLTQVLSWQLLFYINLIPGALVTLFAWKTIDFDRPNYTH